MKNQKLILSLFSGAVLIPSLLSQSASAQTVLESGTSTLADTLGTATGPEAITISWSVSETGTGAAAVYTYSYVVNNPTGDVLLNSAGAPTTTPEIVDAFSVAFDTTAVSGGKLAFIPGTQTGGVADQNNGANGLFWSFAAVTAGSSSAPLSFESQLAPGLGNANAQDANPPSPWSSYPSGQQVPVPASVPEPSSTALFAAVLILAVPFRAGIRKFVRSV